MQKNKYSVSLYFTLLSFCPFLFIGIVFGVLSGCSEKSEQAKASHESVSEKKNIAELPKIGEIVTTETLSDGEEKKLDIRSKQVRSSTHEGIAFPNIININNKAYAKHTKGIVTFTHKKHMDEYAKKFPDFFKNGCGDCHHDANNKPIALKAGDNVQGCIECHKQPGERPKGKDAPKLSKKERLAYHTEAIHYECKDCHKGVNKKTGKRGAPTTCSKCHLKKI